MNLEAGHIGGSTRSRTAPHGLWRPSRRALRLRMQLSLMAIDIACMLVCFATANSIYQFFAYQMNVGGADQAGLTMAALIIPTYLAVAMNAGAYSIDIFQRNGHGISTAVRALLISIGILTLAIFYLKVGAQLSRAAFGVASVLSIATVAGARALFMRNSRRMLGGSVFSTVLISDGQYPPPGGEFSAYISADSWLDPENDCPIMYDRLATALKEADRVVVACGPTRRLAWVKALKGANVRSEVVAPELIDLAPMGISRWEQTPTLVIADGPLSQADAMTKRAFDLALASAALVALSPLFLIIALLIKRDSKGPVFFKQTRIGLGNRMFKMFKFRSMRVETLDAAGDRSASRDDDRITPIGRFIRKTSIDELPQLLNVLTGDMSIVGPRPHALGSRAADKLFWEVDANYWHRHAAKPGLTGLAQVRGFRGATEFERDLTNRLYADLEYLRDWSLWKDLMIMFQTFRVLVHRNAF